MALHTTNPGDTKRQMNLAPFMEWVSTQTYNTDDLVVYNSNIWKALQSNRGQTPVAGVYWTSVVAGISGGGMLTLTRNFTAAQIKTLFTDSPITLIAAPGLGKAIIPSSVTLVYTFATHPFYANAASSASTFKIGSLALYTLLLEGGSPVYSSGFNIGATAQGTGISVSPISQITSQLAVYILQPFNSVSASGTNPLSDFANLPFTLASLSDMINGTPLTFTINAAGLGYAVGDTLADDSMWGAGDLLVTVDTVDGFGAVLTYTVTNVGTSGWHVNPPADTSSVITFSNVAPQSGIGTGFALNVASIAQGDGTLRLTVQYQILDLL